MIHCYSQGAYLLNQTQLRPSSSETADADASAAREHTMAYQILRRHDCSSNPDKMQIRFDALISHDITYVGIIQTARASGLTEFPLPYAMTNCHNSLCAVGGTINEDDHVFGLSAAKKYGGIYVPANQAVIHQYAREELAACGRMILGSDSHTRYGAYGTMGIGEGGPELVKQLLKNTYDIDAPQVVLVYLENAPRPGVGPHDVAIALCGAVFKNGFVKNKILEFAGPGIANLSTDFRIGIDVMTTETTCLSSIWPADEKVKAYYENHGRPEAYAPLAPGDVAYYDSYIKIDLAKVEPMIALPFHPSNAYTLREFKANARELLHHVETEAKELFGDKVTLSLTDKILPDGRIQIDQGIIAGCAGGMYENLVEAAAILKHGSIANGAFSLNVYPSSVPISLALAKNGTLADLLSAGAIIKPAFCGPCFGAGDVPSHNGLSIRHTTRNFPNREGSKPGQGQLSCVALMDARSIAATAANGGILTGADEFEYTVEEKPYTFDASVYKTRCYNGYGKANPSEPLILGPNITDWPTIHAPKDHLLVQLAAVIQDEVTTTDELIPSGETSSYRSNPLKLAEFALSRREPAYVGRSKAIRALDEELQAGTLPASVRQALASVCNDPETVAKKTTVGSAIFAKKPGDGSAREQAASCQRVLGGAANFCYEYATKRYRSNCINWGIFPFTIDPSVPFDYEPGDYIFVPHVTEAVRNGQERIEATVITANGTKPLTLTLKGLTDDEKTILLDGCLMNYYKAKHNQ
jgi:aconitate hydratase